MSIGGVIMENNIDCEVIKDLLPSYVDGIVSEETREIIREHISNCNECREEYKRMDITIETKSVEKKQIDFLKGINIKSRNALLLLIGISGALFCLCLCLIGKETNETVFGFCLFLMLIMMAGVEFVLPLFCTIASAFLYKQKKKKIWILPTIIFGAWYIAAIIMTVRNIIIY